MGVVLCFGIAFALLSGSGIGADIFGENPGDAESSETLEDISSDAEVDEEGDGEGLSADVSGDDEPTVTGVVLAGGQFAVQLVGSVALLPITLTRLGFPSYFAVPVGGVAQIIAFIGLAQFIGGREYI
ncbi:MAG: hypothetical protein ACLFR6_06610 [Salinarchaeum sp.]